MCLWCHYDVSVTCPTSQLRDLFVGTGSSAQYQGKDRVMAIFEHRYRFSQIMDVMVNIKLEKGITKNLGILREKS